MRTNGHSVSGSSRFISTNRFGGGREMMLLRERESFGWVSTNRRLSYMDVYVATKTRKCHSRHGTASDAMIVDTYIYKCYQRHIIVS